MSREELEAVYNVGVIVRRRLERLLWAEDLLFDGKGYELNNRHHVFAGIERCSDFLKKLYS
jgi:hypothetical protein